MCCCTGIEPGFEDKWFLVAFVGFEFSYTLEVKELNNWNHNDKKLGCILNIFNM